MLETGELNSNTSPHHDEPGVGTQSRFAIKASLMGYIKERDGVLNTAATS